MAITRIDKIIGCVFVIYLICNTIVFCHYFKQTFCSCRSDNYTTECRDPFFGQYSLAFTDRNEKKIMIEKVSRSFAAAIAMSIIWPIFYALQYVIFPLVTLTIYNVGRLLEYIFNC